MTQNERHGKTHTTTYKSWELMKSRCLNVQSENYEYYGGRGIKVCDSWLNFRNFYADMGDRPEGLTLDRIDVNGNYEPSNCRWTTSKEQGANKRKPAPCSTEFSDYELTIWGRPGTLRTYTNLFKNHIADNITRQEMFKLDEPKLLSLMQLWMNDGLADRTIKQLVRMTVRYSKFLGGLPPETAPLMRKLTRQKQENKVRSLTIKEAKTLLDFLEPKHLSLYLICLFGIHAGLRRGEIFGLQYGDIDALRNRITVQRSYNGPTKNGKTRQVPMSDRLAKALEQKGYLTKPPGEVIFDIFDPNHDLKKVARLLGIRDITIHDLRHTFATLALESGVSPRLVSSWLGHSSLTTTLNIYWSVLPSDSRMDFAP